MRPTRSLIQLGTYIRGNMCVEMGVLEFVEYLELVESIDRDPLVYRYGLKPARP